MKEQKPKIPEVDMNKITGGQPTEIGLLREMSDRLFKDKKVRFSFHEKGDELPNTMKIIIEERLTLFFYDKTGEWKYDGWEMGDYNNYWTKGKL